MARPGNQHCASCIGTFSLPTGAWRIYWVRRKKYPLKILGNISLSYHVDVILVSEVHG